MKKLFTRFVLVFLLLGSNVSINAWPGFPLPALHVNGRNLQDPCGNNVVLHGVAVTPSPWFNGCQYGSTSGYCTWSNYDVEGCLAYNNAVIDRLTDTSDGWYLNYIRLHIDPYWSNTPGVPVSGESDISAFSYNRFVTYVDKVIIPIIEHARERGMYVILRPPGVCPDKIAVGDAYHNYLKTIWTYLSKHPALKNSNNVMFELANEPVQILGIYGNYGTTGDEHFAALKNFFQPIVDIIRNNGANNVCWIPGTGWQSHYQGYVNHSITGGNIGYAVHIYPGYWGGIRDYSSFISGWNTNVKPIANIAPVAITETDWAPEGYGTFGVATTGTAGGSGFGANFNHITYTSGNVSWNLLCFDDLLDHGSPNGGTAFGGDWQACAAPVKHWFKGFAEENLPVWSCGGNPSTSLVDGGIYTIALSTDETKMLDLRYGDDSNGGVLRPYTSNGATAQQWKAISDGNGYWSFVSVASSSGRCVDLDNGNTTNGTTIRLWDYYGTDAQKWMVTDVGNGYYKIVSKLNASKSWDTPNCVVDGSKSLQLWDYYGTSCQLFKFNYKSMKAITARINTNGLEDCNGDDAFVIYPNPSVNGTFDIELNEYSGELVDIIIYTMAGKRVFRKTYVTNSAMHVESNLAEGVYLVQVKLRDKVKVQKIAIQ